MTAASRTLIIGQAPVTKVHASGVPWGDASGDRLRDWLGLAPEDFYDETRSSSCRWGSITRGGRKTAVTTRLARNAHRNDTGGCAPCCSTSN
ncbi:MAG: uracil-DNA glycosylase family protein [Rhodospirillaceae bacterium]